MSPMEALTCWSASCATPSRSPIPNFHAREISLLGSRNATREDFVAVFQAMRDELVPTGALATHRASLEQSASLFSDWIKPETGVIKALIEI